MGRRSRTRSTRAQSRGAVSILMVVLLATIGMAALVSIDVGHVFYRQRQLQSVADMAALAAAQQLRRADTNAAMTERALAAAQASAGQNGFTGAARQDCGASPGGEDGMAVCAGVWDPNDAAAAADGRHFRGSFDPARLSPNAVRVVVSQTVPILFGLPGGDGRRLRAEAIGNASPPVASFSVGSGLLNFESSRSALALLLGNTISLSAADWQGLVDTRVTLDQLRLEAGLGTVDELLNADLSLSRFYALVLRAANKESLLNAMLGGMPGIIDARALAAGLSVGRVLDLGVLAPAMSSAADVGLNVAELLMLAAQVANKGAAVDLAGAVPLLPGTQLALQIVEPPRMAVGPVRASSTDPMGWETTARTSQVDLGVRLNLGGEILGGSLISVNLPLRVQLGTAHSALTGMRCAAARSDRRATLNTVTTAATVCLARDDLSQCATSDVVVTNLAGIKITASPKQQTIPGNGMTSTLAPGEQTSTASQGQLAALVESLARNLDVKLIVAPVGIPIVNLDLKLGGIVSALSSVIFGLLGPTLDGLLAALGIQLSNADLWVHDVDCDNTRLVY
ncbi:pilus assembly protein TadG-related protein [Cupriavidus sp. DB3]|uniref:TadG family pilus assembly protein n=1 Tax=Cupriavidus sp. DB3 TaxID=2873259 RepID=UPI001CF4A058|nr:TadG family pilus assembly protein [Cupriavidus sp. DB3]MCA7082008.1 pilus assembly protein TadG-related protein [Cupriavidus sp. DB3]